MNPNPHLEDIVSAVWNVCEAADDDCEVLGMCTIFAFETYTDHITTYTDHPCGQLGSWLAG